MSASVTGGLPNAQRSDHVPAMTAIGRCAPTDHAQAFVPLWLARLSVYQDVSTQALAHMLADAECVSRSVDGAGRE
eukprot:6562531-Pyramimonas_sp.AAC.1